MGNNMAIAAIGLTIPGCGLVLSLFQKQFVGQRREPEVEVMYPAPHLTASVGHAP